MVVALIVVVVAIRKPQRPQTNNKTAAIKKQTLSVLPPPLRFPSAPLSISLSLSLYRVEEQKPLKQFNRTRK